MVRLRPSSFSVLILITLLVQLGTPGIAWADGEAPPETPTEAEAPTVAEALAAVPEGTQVVVLNAEGAPEPLATQVAAEAVLASDPIWCDASPTPLCTPPQASVTALLNLLGSAPTTYFGDGTIYFTTPYALDDIRISGGDTRVAALQRLVIDGDNYLISVPIEVTNWAYDVTVQDLDLNLGSYAGTAAALRVETAGAILVQNVDVTGGGGDGAYLDNTAGSAGVTVDGSTFDGNTWTGLDVRSDGSVLLQNISANGQEDGAYVDVSTGPGNITVGDSDFSNNSLAGMTARSGSGGIRLTNVVADLNTASPPPPPTGPSAPSTVVVGSAEAYGIGLTSEAGGAIDVLNSFARNNEGHGLWIEATGPVDVQGMTASNNGSHGAYIHNMAACQAAPINVTVTGGTYENNLGYGILAVLGPAGNFTLAGSPTFTGNVLGDYAVNLDPCPECDKEHGPGKPYNTIFVPEVSLRPVPLDCAQFAGTIFILPSGDRATLVCPVEGEATASPLPQTGLPGPLPTARTFVTGLTVERLKDGQPAPVITEGGYLTISFEIPEELRGKSLAILYWDPAGGAWVELPAYAARPDGTPIVHRLHPEVTPDDLMNILGGVRVYGESIKVKVNFTGSFILVAR